MDSSNSDSSQQINLNIHEKSCHQNVTPSVVASSKYQQKINRFRVDVLSKADKESIDFSLAEFFFGCNIPFAVVDSTHFESLLQKLRPSYKPPHSNTLKSTLLEMVYKKKVEQGYQKQKRYGTLMLDGWKNSTNQQKNITMIVKPRYGCEIFLKSFDFTTQSETSENIKQVIFDACESSEVLYNISIEALVSDNAAAMVKAGKESNLIFYICCAHTGNLAVGDIVNYELTESVRSLLIDFRRTALQQWIIEAGGTKLYVANQTRWKGQLDELKLCVKNRAFMKQAAAKDSRFSKN
jgi:Protein of unknown function (DUF 659)